MVNHDEIGFKPAFISRDYRKPRHASSFCYVLWSDEGVCFAEHDPEIGMWRTPKMYGWYPLVQKQAEFFLKGRHLDEGDMIPLEPLIEFEIVNG